MLRRLHLAIGLSGVVAFVLTGQYMDRWLDHLQGMPDLPRMLYRSAHIYLLLASLLNLSLGLYLTDGPSGWRLWMRRIGSIPVAMAPVLFLLAFAREPLAASFHRPFVGPAVYGVFLGALLHAVSHIRSARLRLGPRR